MRSRLTTLLTVIGAVTVLVLAGNTVALAATGKGFLLGKTNKSTAATTLQRTKAGPALSLRTKSGPPLAVGNSTLVKQLNADKVDGYDASALVNGGTLFTITIPAAHPVSSQLDALSVKPGQYQVTWSAHLSIDVATTAFCAIGTLTKPDYTLTGTTAGNTTSTLGVNDAGKHEALLSGTGPITVHTGEILFLQCYNLDSSKMTTVFPTRVVVTPITTTPGKLNQVSRATVPLN